MVYILFIFLLLGNFAHIHAGLNEMVWHEMRAKSPSQPCGRFDALTWVDGQNELWLYGGNTLTKTNGSEFTTHLHDLWKFHPGSYQWTRIAHQNSSKYPRFGKGLSCFCSGWAFVFGHQVHKKKPIPELWVYNITLNFWNLTKMPSDMKHMQDCFGLWCNKDTASISLLCSENGTVVKLWNFMIKSGNWNFKTISNNIMSRNISDENISKSVRFSVWNDPNGRYGPAFVYAWSYPRKEKNSVLLSVCYNNITITQVNVTKPEYFSNRRGFIRWVDSHENLHLLGGKVFNSTTIHWMFNKTRFKWGTVNSRNLKPRPRNGDSLWYVGGNLWLFGGYMKDGKGLRVVLDDFWIGNSSKPVVPRPTPIHHSLPGDTLGLSMANKLIISMVTLFVVMAVSIRLCYKRELNHLLSKLKKNRVVYHQLSQEGDKSTRL